MRNYIFLIVIIFFFNECENNKSPIYCNQKTDSLNNVTFNSSCYSKYDTLLINELKSYFYKETDKILKGNFYTDTASNEDSLYCLCVSLPNKIEKPEEYSVKTSSLLKFLMKTYPVKKSDLNVNPKYRYCHTIKEIKELSKKNRNKGYHTYYFDANLNSATLLNKNLFDSTEILSIIVFHELMHNYIYQKNFELSIYYNEAICSVVGNYLALKYARETNNADTMKIKKYINIEEELFRCINKYTVLINSNNRDYRRLINEFKKQRFSIIAKWDICQNFTNTNEINNAYLLEMGIYSKEYFKIKELYLKYPNTKESISVLYKFLLSDQDYTTFL